MPDEPKLTAELIEQILATAPPNCWVAVVRSDFRLVGTGPTSVAAVQAAADNGFEPDSIMLLWSAGAAKQPPRKAETAAGSSGIPQAETKPKTGQP